MAWQDVVTPLVRYAINDVDDTQRYEDYRLQYAWLVGMNYVNTEINLSTNYTIDLVNVNISPDPTIVSSNLATPDNWAVNLGVARTAIFMIMNDLKLAANSAWSIKDVGMAADMREIYKANKMILDEIKNYYDTMKTQYMVGYNPQGAAILTPINIWSAGYRRPQYGWDSRSSMVW